MCLYNNNDLSAYSTILIYIKINKYLGNINLLVIDILIKDEFCVLYGY